MSRLIFLMELNYLRVIADVRRPDAYAELVRLVSRTGKLNDERHRSTADSGSCSSRTALSYELKASIDPASALGGP